MTPEEKENEFREKVYMTALDKYDAEMLEEQWVPIKGFEERYLISSKSRVKALSFLRKTRCSFQPVPEKILKPRKNKNGYMVVDLRFNKKRKMSYLHRLVAQHFIENVENKRCVNHKNGVKTDNRIENLEWCTQAENIRHSIKNGLRKYKKGAK